MAGWGSTARPLRGRTAALAVHMALVGVGVGGGLHDRRHAKRLVSKASTHRFLGHGNSCSSGLQAQEYENAAPRGRPRRHVRVSEILSVTCLATIALLLVAALPPMGGQFLAIVAMPAAAQCFRLTFCTSGEGFLDLRMVTVF